MDRAQRTYALQEVARRTTPVWKIRGLQEHRAIQLGWLNILRGEHVYFYLKTFTEYPASYDCGVEITTLGMKLYMWDQRKWVDSYTFDGALLLPTLDIEGFPSVWAVQFAACRLKRFALEHLCLISKKRAKHGLDPFYSPQMRQSFDNMERDE